MGTVPRIQKELRSGGLPERSDPWSRETARQGFRGITALSSLSSLPATSFGGAPLADHNWKSERRKPVDNSSSRSVSPGRRQDAEGRRVDLEEK